MIIVLGDDNAGEGGLGGNEGMPASEVLGGFKGSVEGGTAEAGFTDTDPEGLGDGGWMVEEMSWAGVAIVGASGNLGDG